MVAAIGQTIRDVVLIRDDAGVPVSGLSDTDFDPLEFYSLDSAGTFAVVGITEGDAGEYLAEFEATAGGQWIFHYRYEGAGFVREESRRFEVAASAALSAVATGGAWTYTEDFDVPRNVVRHLIGDTDPTSPMLSDAEIGYELGAAGDDASRAAYQSCRRLMARYAALADASELDLSVKASQLFDHYAALAATFETDADNLSMRSAVPYAGGLSVAERRTNRADRDRTMPFFDRPWGKSRAIPRDPRLGGSR